MSHAILLLRTDSLKGVGFSLLDYQLNNNYMSTLGDARMPNLKDKIAEEARQAELRAEKEDLKSLKVVKIIKKKSKKN